MSILLKTHNLSKRYKTTLALNDVNMTIRRGDIYGFVGENGAGKSTLIRVVTSVNQPTYGSYTLNVEKRPGSVAAIVETPALHNRLTALDNLKYQNDLLGLGKTNEELVKLLNLVGLTEQLTSKKQSKNFSLGMKQRLSIAMALLSNPEFVLLDEPMNGLDPVGIKEIRELILNLNHEHNVTFLISSHILSELDKIATVYGFISHGQLLKEISTKELHASVGAEAHLKLAKAPDKNVVTLLTGFNYKINENTLVFLDEAEGQKAMQHLIKNDVIIMNFETVRHSIEDYYFDIISGGKQR